jgi:DNA topoisomerase I
LSTLRNKHVKFDGNTMKLAFKGKKGVAHEINLTDRNLARLVKKCRDIPGQELFQYYTPGGDRKSIDSGMVNRYIREITDCDFTAKDFRTWYGTLEALKCFASYGVETSENKRKKVANAVFDQVAGKLGNTRSVCKKYYVFPALTEAYERGELGKYLKKLECSTSKVTDIKLTRNEQVLLKFLKDERDRKVNAP